MTVCMHRNECAVLLKQRPSNTAIIKSPYVEAIRLIVIRVIIRGTITTITSDIAVLHHKTLPPTYSTYKRK
jgi:hypothetical protein